MNYRLPESYVLNKFMSYSIEPEFKKHNRQYNAACPVCKEGKSLGKKKRLWYYPDTSTFHCFNCNQTWSALNWIKKITGMSYEDIQIDLSENDFSLDVFRKENGISIFKRRELPDLPYDSINLFDPIQEKYYSKSKPFQDALICIKGRRLDTAINKSPNLFISLTDVIHANLGQVHIINRLFKESYQENKDSFGMDSLLLKKDENENAFIAHRIQIKLGVSCIKIEDAKKFTSIVDSQLKNFKECFTNANKTISNCVNYLVTTRGMDQSAKDHFQQCEWQIVGKKELDQIWPDSIKALGKPYK